LVTVCDYRPVDRVDHLLLLRPIGQCRAGRLTLCQLFSVLGSQLSQPLVIGILKRLTQSAYPDLCSLSSLSPRDFSLNKQGGGRGPRCIGAGDYWSEVWAND
jgi:hypothetical protein